MIFQNAHAIIKINIMRVSDAYIYTENHYNCSGYNYRLSGKVFESPNSVQVALPPIM